MKIKLYTLSHDVNILKEIDNNGGQFTAEEQMQMFSELSCQKCGHTQIEKMPTDYCQWFYECKKCSSLLKPKEGDCCVFCSYGTVKCPPKQSEECCS